MTCAQRLKRVFNIDVEKCRECGGAVKVIACIEKPVVHQWLPLPHKKTQIALRLDSDVLAWFKAQGLGYQTRINAVLKAYKAAHEKSDT